MNRSHRHVPIRSCAVCRTRSPKRALLRFRRGEDGWRLDPAAKGGGRGAWLCRACAERRDPKALRRAFRGAAGDVAAQLERYLPQTEPNTDDRTDDPAPAHAAGPGTPRTGGTHG